MISPANTTWTSPPTSRGESVLGTYSIDANGDTTLSDYGVYKIADGELGFDQTIKAAAS